MLKVINARFTGRFSCVVLVLAVAFGGGCGGNTTHRPSLIGMDSSVEWVFQAPTQFGWTLLGLSFRPRTENIGGAVCTDDGKLVVLSNYGSPFYGQNCNAYLLDLETGRIIRRVTGPYGACGHWYLDGKTIYVKDMREDHFDWWSLDLCTGRTLKGIRQPKGKRYEEFGRYPMHKHPMHEKAVPYTTEPRDESSGGKKWYNRLGGGRELVFTSWDQSEICRDWGSIKPIMELVFTDATSKKHTRRLGRLRRVNPIACYVLVNDQRRLLFVTGSHVICVDMRGYPTLGIEGQIP